MRHYGLKRIVAGLILIAPATPALAGGFYLQEQSPREIGRANSGGAAAADEASMLQANPAGMTRLPGLDISAGGTLLAIGSRQSDRGSTRTYPGVAGATAIVGGDGGNPFKPVVPIPSFYATKQISDRVWVGLGVSAPFGMALEYSPDFFGRYESLGTDLKTYNVQPSAAFAVNDWLSVGGGIDVQYATVKLSNALPNAGAGQPDGRVDIKADDLSFGWNAGVLMTANRIRVGVHYRSGIRHALKGKYVTSGLVGPLAGGNISLPATAPLPLPDIVTASLTADVTPRARLMATARFYNWSVLQAIAITPSGRATTRKIVAYKDSYSLSIGGEYDVNEQLTLRAGAMYDATPTNATFRITRVPDGDRRWLAAGASYALNTHMTLDLSYAHTFIEGGNLSRKETFYSGSAAVTTIDTEARSRGHVNMVAAAIAARF